MESGILIINKPARIKMSFIVCCVVMSDGIIGPYFFEDEEEHPERITGAVYRKMIENFLCRAVEHNQEVWFQ